MQFSTKVVTKQTGRFLFEGMPNPVDNLWKSRLCTPQIALVLPQNELGNPPKSYPQVLDNFVDRLSLSPISPDFSGKNSVFPQRIRWIKCGSPVDDVGENPASMYNDAQKSYPQPLPLLVEKPSERWEKCMACPAGQPGHRMKKSNVSRVSPFVKRNSCLPRPVSAAAHFPQKGSGYFHLLSNRRCSFDLQAYNKSYGKGNFFIPFAI